eukprot:2993335-Pleurochrysis_carterae.AAC.1
MDFGHKGRQVHFAVALVLLVDAIRFGYDIAELLDVRNAHLLRNKAAAEAHRNAGASEDSD